MNAPVMYYGGKGTMYREIIARFPQPQTYCLYMEPFGGAYSVGFHMD